MHGVFYSALKVSFPIRNYIKIISSSKWPDYHWLDADRLIENIEHQYGWASQEIPNSSIEIQFINSVLFLSGYSIMMPSGDDELLRNWKVDCFQNNKNITVDYHQDDDILCPGIHSDSNYCNFNDKHYFELTDKYYCKSVKITQIGFNSSGRNFFELSALDFSGAIYLEKSHSQCYCVYRSVVSISMFQVFVVIFLE